AVQWCRDSLPGRIMAIAFAPDGATLISAHSGGVSLWHVKTGKELMCWEDSARCIAFAPNGHTVAWGRHDGTVVVHELGDLFRERRRRNASALAKPTTSLSAGDLDALWNDLAGDAPKAYAAIWALARAPEQVIPQLKKRLEPVASADGKWQAVRTIEAF